MFVLALLAMGLFPAAAWAEEKEPQEEKGVTVFVTEASDEEALKAFLGEERLEEGNLPEEFQVTQEEAKQAQLSMKFTSLPEKAAVGEDIPVELGLYREEKLLGILAQDSQVKLSAEPEEAVSQTEKGMTAVKTGELTVRAIWGEMKAEGALSVECGHPEDKKSINETKPSCEEPGKRITACGLCGAELENQELPALGHSWGEWKTEKEAACTEAGIRVRSCEREGCRERQTEDIPKLEHQWSDWKVTKEAAWEQAGEESRTCGFCKETQKRELPPLKEGHTHDFSGEETVEREATCAKEGVRAISCADPRCGEKKLVPIPVTEHQWGKWTVTKEAAWSQEGSRERSCSVCGQEETEAIIALSVGHEHDFSGKEEVTAEAACLKEGVKLIHCIAPECTETIEEVIPALGHAWGDWETTKEATCLEKGARSRSCGRCQEKETEELPLAAHKEGKWKVVREATCRDTGAQLLPCQICGKTLKEAEIEKLEHEWGKWRVTKEATQEEKGEKEAVCQVCGAKKTAKLERLETPEKVKPRVPKTGDTSGAGMWAAAGILAAAAILILALVGRRLAGRGGR